MLETRIPIPLCAALLLVTACGYGESTVESTWRALLDAPTAEREVACSALDEMGPPSDAQLLAQYELQIAACDFERILSVQEPGPVTVEEAMDLLEQLVGVEALAVDRGNPLETAWLERADARSTHQLVLALGEVSPPSAACGTPAADRATQSCVRPHLGDETRELCEELDLLCSLEDLRATGADATLMDACVTHAARFTETAHHDAFFEWACSLPGPTAWDFEGRSACVAGIAAAGLDDELKSECMGKIVTPIIKDLTVEDRGERAMGALVEVGPCLDEVAVSAIARKARTRGAWTHTSKRRPAGHHCTNYTRVSTPKAYWAAKALTRIGEPRVEPDQLARADDVIGRKSRKTWKTTDPGWV